VRTEGVRPNVVTGETVHLRKFTTVNRADVEQVLPTFPHYLQVSLLQPGNHNCFEGRTE